MKFFPRNWRTLLVARNLSAAGLVAAAICSVGPVWANVVPKPTINTFALYAERSVKLGANDVIKGGHVGVAAAGPTRLAPQVSLGASASADLKFNIFASSVALESSATAGVVQAHKIIGGGTMTLAGVYPYAGMPPIPLITSTATTGPDVTIPAGQMRVLAPGAYGALSVDGVARLAPGAYSFSRMRIGDSASLNSTSKATCAKTFGPQCTVTISVAGLVVVGSSATIAPLYEQPAIVVTHPPQKPLPLPRAAALVISVVANDPSASAPVVQIGASARIRALLSAPGGTLSFADDAAAVGAFSAFDIIAGARVQITFDSGFPTAYATGTQKLTGYYGPPPNPDVAPVIGVIPLTQSVMLDIGLPVKDGENGERVRAAVREVSDPHSPSYRHYLTIDQFIANFGATPADYAALIAWAKSRGFAIDATYKNRLVLSVSGTVAQIQQALHVNLVLRQRFDGSSFVTADREPSIDLTLPVLRISGLDDFVVPAHHGVNGTFAVPGQSPIYAAADLRAAYLGVGSTCQTLTGNGQVIGILSFSDIKPSDVSAYDALQLPPAPSFSNLLPTLYIAGGPLEISGPGTEAWLDVEMAQAIAPNAKIQMVVNDIYNNLFNFGHADAALHALATTTPAITVASNSWDLGRDVSEQQALYEMALQGVSFVDASGDSGAANDPQDFRDLDAITLVGGTVLNTNPLTSAGGYPSPYYAGENTWNNWAAGTGTGATQGGVMNGTQNLQEEGLPSLVSAGDFPACECFPYPTCCGSPVPIPSYQSQAGIGGPYRTYPDVSMAATSLGIFAQGTPQSDGGTSGAAPLWAGFLALANELSIDHQAGLIGFANPVLYAIGMTSGSSPDLYKACFNDVADGQSNGRFGDPGYKSTAGYDMATGWGSPTCGLIHQLATTTPLVWHEPLPYLDLLIITGHDNFDPLTALSAVLNFANGKTATLALKPQGVNWNNGAMVPIFADLRQFLCPTPSTCGPNDLPTLESGITSITLNMFEGQNGPTFTANWDISGLQVRLYPAIGGDIQEACQFNLAGDNTLQDGHQGVVRLSSTISSSGIGTQVTFAASGPAAANVLVGTHCANTGSPLPTSGTQPQPGIQFIFSTGSDNLDGRTGLQAQAFDSNNKVLDTWTLKAAGAAEWKNDTSEDIIASWSGNIPDHMTLTLQQHSGGTNADDTWNVDGINIVMWNKGGAEICFTNIQPSSFNDDAPILKLKNNTATLKLTNCKGGT